MKKINQIICIVTFYIIIFTVPILTFTRQHDKFLYYENRYIDSFPKYTFEKVLTGEYFNEFENHFSSIFIGRNTILKANTIYEKVLMNKNVVNNIVIQDEILLPYNKHGVFYSNKINEYACEAVSKIKEIKDALESIGVKYYYVGVPEQMSYFSDKYPKYFNNGDEHFNLIDEAMKKESAKQNVNFISLKSHFKTLKDEELKEELYFKTDHHFTYYGAFKAYEKIMEVVNKDFDNKLFTYKEEDIKFEKLNNVFVGSLSRKLMMLFSKDEKAIYPIKQEFDYVKYDNDDLDNPKYEMIEDVRNQDTNVTYSIYMGGDIAHTVVKTNREELPNVLVYGDSFTNPLETLFYASFNEMHSIDYRFYKDKNLLKYVKDNDIDLVIAVKDDTSYFNNEGNGADLIK